MDATNQPLLDVRDLSVAFGRSVAVDGISFSIKRGECVALVGESGSGKSTFARLVMALERPSAGTVSLLGRDLNRIPPDELRRARRDFQMVFQDPTDSLNPRFTAARAIADPIMQLGDVRGRAALRDRCEELARLVGLQIGRAHV